MTAATSGVPREISPQSGARVLPVPPPLYYAAAFAAGMALKATTVPLPIGGRPASVLLGVATLASGAALAIAGVATVVRHHTTIVPHHAVSTLISTGAYRISRNPMYAGLAIAYVGGAMVASSWWPLATLPFALFAVRRLVIDPEERYLTGHFSQAYTDYQTRVRRWV
jgi:protein-S-isoprenylcysteine O-methyltransferase Ste14